MTSGKPGGLIVNRSKRSKNHEPPKGSQTTPTDQSFDQLLLAFYIFLYYFFIPINS